MLGAIILGAGLSRRMGKDKLLLPLGNKTVLEMTLEKIDHPEIDKKILVVGKNLKEKIKNKENLIILVNQHPEEGQSSSLKLGINYALDHYEWEGCIVFLGDQPFLEKSNIDQAVKMWLKNKDHMICLQHKNKKGHPTIFGKKWLEPLMKIQGDFGGKELIRKNPKKVIWMEGDETCVMDIDTREDYEKAVKLI